EGSGMLFRITQSVLSLAKNTSNLIAATIGTCFFINLTAADQYLSILITGRMYKESYRLKDLAPENLSRALEDSGTLSSPLVPWNSCGAFMAASLGVSTLAYFPFCFFNLINPVISLIYAFTGFTITKISSLDGHESTGTLGYKNAG
ncbi:MAG: sodium:proton antiporter, partial [Leptospiraceae bacterium]|nr:sodium:proton antiporter [Leptospiraceae bacterium]